MKDSNVLEVLLVEDDPAHAELIQRAFSLRSTDFRLCITQTIAAALPHIKARTPNLVIADWLLPDGKGTELIRTANGSDPIPVIVMTSHGNELVAVEALKAGALDYVVKTDASLADMPHIAGRVLEEWENRIQRQRAEQELRRRVYELEAINRISTALRTALTLDEILNCLVDEILATLGAEVGMIWLYHPETSSLHPNCGRGWLAQVATEPLDYGSGIAGFVFISGKAHISSEFSKDTLAHQTGARKFQGGWGGVWIPIHTAEQVVGVLLVALPSTRQVTQDEIHLLTTVAEMAGNAIHRANLYEQTERSLKRLNALRAIDTAITASTELKLSLNVLVNQAALLLDADAIVIRKLDPLTQNLEFLTEKGFPAIAIKNIRLGQAQAGQAALERRPISIPDVSKSAMKDAGREPIHIEPFHAYHAVPLICRGHLKGVFEVFHRNPFQPNTDWHETLTSLAGQAAIAIENTELFDELEKSNLQLRMAYDATIEGWSRALDMRDRETEGHTQRVAEMTVQLAHLMGFDENELVHIRRGALLHDIGKMGIPDSILTKPAPLTEDEWTIMRQHPGLAKSMLASIEYLRPALDIPYYHHERWDGTGYPLGLKGQKIPLAARIFAVVDVWDALRSNRPYREAWPAHEIETYLQDQSGIQFDSQVISLFLKKVAR